MHGLRTTGSPLARFARKCSGRYARLRRTSRCCGPPHTSSSFESHFSSERLLRASMFFGLLAAFLVATVNGTLLLCGQRRTSEVGIRMALGARRGQVLWDWCSARASSRAWRGIFVGSPLAIPVAAAAIIPIVGMPPHTARPASAYLRNARMRWPRRHLPDFKDRYSWRNANWHRSTLPERPGRSSATTAVFRGLAVGRRRRRGRRHKRQNVCTFGNTSGQIIRVRNHPVTTSACPVTPDTWPDTLWPDHRKVLPCSNLVQSPSTSFRHTSWPAGSGIFDCGIVRFKFRCRVSVMHWRLKWSSGVSPWRNACPGSRGRKPALQTLGPAIGFVVIQQHDEPGRLRLALQSRSFTQAAQRGQPHRTASHRRGPHCQLSVQLPMIRLGKRIRTEPSGKGVNHCVHT